MALTPGAKLGPYEIHSPLGAGGMGEVYRARDTRLDREVAIKVLPTSLSSDGSLKQRLEREAKAISKLSHPHICILHDIGHQDGVDFLVMEYLEGETLEQRLSKGPLPPSRPFLLPLKWPARSPKPTNWVSFTAISSHRMSC
jgi:eukaryotic-like serine/threonine-protein kinase